MSLIGLKIAKNANVGNLCMFFAVFKPLTGIKTSPNYYLFCREGSKLQLGWLYVKIH